MGMGCEEDCQKYLEELAMCLKYAREEPDRSKCIPSQWKVKVRRFAS